MAQNEVLRGERLRLVFGSGDQAFAAVDGVDVSLEDRRYTAIVGPSGSGKSSLLYLLSGLRRPTSGSVRFRGVDYAALGDAGVAALRRRDFGFIFQQHFLVNYLGALENVLVAARSPGPAARARALELLERLSLGSKAGHRPYQLSVGERQRVAVARAMVSAAGGDLRRRAHGLPRPAHRPRGDRPTGGLPGARRRGGGDPRPRDDQWLRHPPGDARRAPRGAAGGAGGAARP